MAPEALPQWSWGVELGGSELRRLRARCEAGALRIDAYHAQASPWRWDGADDLSSSLREVLAAASGAPLAVAISDANVLFRRLLFPPAPPQTLARMIAAQAEICLPGTAQDFAWGWQTAGILADGRQAILLCAARRQHVEEIVAASGALRGLVVVPSALALAAAFAQLDEPTADRCTLLLDVAAGHTSLVHLRGAVVEHCAVVDQGGDQWTEVLAEQSASSLGDAEKILRNGGADAQTLDLALDEWAHQLEQAHRALVRELDPGSTAQRCVMFGRAARLPGVRQCVQERLQMDTKFIQRPAHVELNGDAPFDTMLSAAGAALHVLKGASTHINLCAVASEAKRTQSPARRRLIWAAAWLVGMVMLLYTLDLFEANRLQRQVDSLRADAARNGASVYSPQVGRYLNHGAAPPLAVLAEVSKSTPAGLILSQINYDRGGVVQISGMANNADQFNEYLHQLAESTLLSNVAPTRSTIKDDKWTFSLEAEAIPVFRYVMRPPKPPADPAPEAKSQAQGDGSEPAEASSAGGGS